MFIIKWVEADNIFSYHAVIEFAETYEAAKEILISVEERLNKVVNAKSKSNIVSEPIIEEIDFDKKSNTKSFQTDKLLFCKMCNEPAGRIVAKTAIEVELIWNEKELIYEVAEETYNHLEDASKVFCSGCLTDLLKQI